MTGHRQPAASAPLVCLALGVHNHQPVGNFDWVYRTHYDEAYRPFLDAMAAHPTLPFSLHISGPLLEWLLREAPDYLDLVRRMVAAGQVEMKGGAFFEAILAAIPDPDKSAQLSRMDAFLAEHLGVHPAGAWLAERVWEPHLALSLAEAGLQYAVLDDSNFLAAGLRPEATYGYYVTEEQGRRFDLFPISKDLRYLIPFHEPDEVLAFLKRLPAEHATTPDAPGATIESGTAPGQAGSAPPPLAVYDDDGEKFGGWPGTREHVYERGWLDRFLTAIEEAQETGWLRVITLGEYRRRYRPLGRIYLPTGSYAEMIEWSGGFYRNFLVRYPEANRLHKRMLLTSRRVREALPARTCAPAYDHLLRAQCNDAYWHGVFGGLYLPHLRHAAYSALLAAERLLPGTARPPIEVLDFDLDGEDEVFLRSPELTVVVSPATGGVLLALDHLPSAFALMDTLRRRREPEHRALEDLAASGRHDDVPGRGSHAQTIHEGVRMKESGLEKLLHADHWPRTSLLDHFYEQSVGWMEMQEARARDLGDFSGGRFEVPAPNTAASPPDRASRPTARPSVALDRQGRVGSFSARIQKRIALGDEAGLVKVDYRVEFNESDEASGAGSPAGAPGVETPEVWFAPELNFNLLAGWAEDRYVLVDGRRPRESLLADGGTHAGASSVTLVDESSGLLVTLRWRARKPGDIEVPCTLHRYGVVTVSLSEDGFERIYQATALVPSWPMPLAAGVRLDVRLEVEVRSG